MLPPARSMRSRIPGQPTAAADHCQPTAGQRSGGRRGTVIDAQGRVITLVAQHDAGGRAGRVAGDVGQRLLDAAVERETRIRRERAGGALDAQGYLHLHVDPEALDQRRELCDTRQVVTAERPDRVSCIRKTFSDELAGAIDRRAHFRSRFLELCKLARSLQLDRRARKRMGEQVVQLARNPAALSDRRGPRLLLARVLELSE